MRGFSREITIIDEGITQAVDQSVTEITIPAGHAEADSPNPRAAKSRLHLSCRRDFMFDF